MTNLYRISYNTNDSTGGVTPVTQTAESKATTYIFSAPTAEQYGLTKTDYLFVGWSENPNATLAAYLPGKQITLTSANSTLVLYAVWANLNISTWDNLYYMQQITPTNCGLGNGVGKQLIDLRDGKLYWVAKLADGNCWMTQNLDYDDPNSIRITSTSGANGGPASGDWKGNGDNQNVREYWDPGEKIVSGNTLITADSSTDRHLLVGNYYSWEAATNGIGKDINTDKKDASESICPDGWKLPTANSNTGQFRLLVNQGKSSWTQYPNTNINGYWLGGTASSAAGAAFFVANGTVTSGNLNNVGSDGYYWSSTAASDTNAYSLLINSSAVSPSVGYNRYVGRSIRCVAK